MLESFAWAVQPLEICAQPTDLRLIVKRRKAAMTDSVELLKKLQVKAGAKVWLINVPRNIAEAITAGAEVETVNGGEACTGVIAFAENPAEVAKMAAQALQVLPPDGLLWFAYRKGEAAKKSGLSRDDGWNTLAKVDWRPVRSISIDEVWTGLRFKPVALVKSDKPDAWRSR
jgi:hypothetical protein